MDADSPPNHTAIIDPPPVAINAPASAAAHAFWLVVLLLGAAAYIYLTHREKKLSTQNPDPWADPNFLDGVLILACEQAVPMRIYPLPTKSCDLAQGKASAQNFSPTGSHFPSAIGPCVHLAGHKLSLAVIHADRTNTSVSNTDVAGTDVASTDVASTDVASMFGHSTRNVRVEFCLSIRGEERLFCFTSALLGMDKGHGQSTLLTLVRPDKMTPLQRRAFPRVRVPRSDVMALGMWDGSPSALNEPWNPILLPPPPLRFLPLQAENVRLDNISANGAALRVRADTLAQTRDQGARWNACVLFVCLRKQNDIPLCLWLACVRCHATTSVAKSASVLLGWSVTHWAKTDNAQSSIAWKTVSSEGIAPLLKWTLQRQTARHPSPCFHL